MAESRTTEGGTCNFEVKRVREVSAIGHVGFLVLAHQYSPSQQKDLTHSPHSVSGPRNGGFCKRTFDEVEWVYNRSKLSSNQVGVVSAVSRLVLKLKKARSHIHELKTELQSSKKKLSDERAMWCSREHEKIRTIIDDMKTNLHREKKNPQRLELANSKLVNELVDSKLSVKRFMLDYEKERNARELIEEVCDKLVDGKAASSMNIQDIRDFTYEPTHPDDFFAVFEDVNFGEINERGVEPGVVCSPDSHALCNTTCQSYLLIGLKAQIVVQVAVTKFGSLTAIIGNFGVQNSFVRFGTLTIVLWTIP
ncbi:hypothetical protein LguiB_013869 [Lonicera macranthoides]